MWDIALKAFSSGKILFDISANIVTCYFNNGLNSLMGIMQVLGVNVDSSSHNFCVEADASHQICRAQDI